MASTGEISKIKERAMSSIANSAARIQTEYKDLQPVAVTTWRHPLYNEAMQLEAIAAWMVELANIIAPETEAVIFDNQYWTEDGIALKSTTAADETEEADIMVLKGTPKPKRAKA